MTQLDLMEGRRRLKKVLESHEEATGYLTDEIDRRLCGMIPDGGKTTVDQAHVVLEEILDEDVELGYPEKDFNRTFLANVFVGKPHWISVGVTRTKRPSRNSGRVTVWQLDKSKIERED